MLWLRDLCLIVDTVSTPGLGLKWLLAAEHDNRNKNSSGDEIANVNFYAVRPEGT